MVWIPGDDEVPMSLSYVESLKGVTIKTMGETSRRIQSIPEGTALGIRGPYGNAFDLSPRRVLIVGGGSGSAVLAPAAERAIASGTRAVAALGAITASELLFRERFQKMGATVTIATDDGSEGRRGYVTDLASQLLREHSFDAVWTCGPEVMMRKVCAAAARRSIPAFCSVERQMKCALGMCDACALGPLHVCIDGPVFPSERLMPISDFGYFKRDAAGRSVPH
jgi:dihydroorotate dehydrogenase electron transfer subunit